MCKVLSISRSTYYSFKEKVLQPDPLTETVIKLFNENQQAYGTRKLKVELAKLNHYPSRRRIASIMKSNDAYTMKKYTSPKDIVNEEKIANIVDRKFDERKPLEIIVSDLTYVRVKNTWHYICIVLDLHYREIIGYSYGARKTVQLVYDAFAKIKANLFDLQIFHTDYAEES
jgi:putative transposase